MSPVKTMLNDDSLEAVYIATDAPSHAEAGDHRAASWQARCVSGAGSFWFP